MTYTQRQLHCLNAMRLVAWTCANHATVLPAVDDKAQTSPFTLSHWLVQQTLLPFAFRGKTVNAIGSEQATLLVVCVHEKNLEESDTGLLPLSSECSRLFDLMMRAIDLPRTAIRQCVVARRADTDAVNGTDQRQVDEPPAVTFNALMTPAVRAVLVLDLQDEWHDVDINPDVSTLPDTALPVWRIPHPVTLLKEPPLKRRAWNNLKALKCALDGRV